MSTIRIRFVSGNTPQLEFKEKEALVGVPGDQKRVRVSYDYEILGAFFVVREVSRSREQTKIEGRRLVYPAAVIATIEITPDSE